MIFGASKGHSIAPVNPQQARHTNYVRTGNAMKIDWELVGISGENNFLQLFFDVHSGTLLAHCYKSIGNGYGIKSLWGRRISEKKYGKVTPDDPSLSFEDPVLSPASHHIYTNVIRVEERNGNYDGYGWDSVRRIDLTTGADEIVISPDGVAADPVGVKAWISTVHGVSGDGRELYCSIANQKRGEDAISPTEYYLSRYIVGEGRIEPITRLLATFL